MTRNSNRVRDLRDARGWSQAQLAELAALTRQSIGAIEAGRAVPGVDVALRIATALGCSVEALFSSTTPGRLTAEPDAHPHTGRAALAHLHGRWVSYALSTQLHVAADALALGERGTRVTVEPIRPLDAARDTVVLMGCAAGLGLLADRLNAQGAPGRVLWFSRSSADALGALHARRTHVAGVHLVDGASGEANLTDVGRTVRDQAVVVITLGTWEAGLVLAPDQARRIRGIGDLTRRGLRVALRKPGSGARRLLDRELARAGIPLSALRPVSAPFEGHLDVARAIALGAADTGIATRDAALAFDLPFVPLAHERYDLVIPLQHVDEPFMQRLLDVMTGSPFRRELSALGYDMQDCGRRVAELKAA